MSKIFFNPSNAEVTFVQSARTERFFENHLNHVVLVLIRKVLLSTLRWVPMCQGFGDFSCFLLHFVLAKLATSSIRVKTYLKKKIKNKAWISKMFEVNC